MPVFMLVKPQLRCYNKNALQGGIGMKTDIADVVIVGAGAIGCAIAYFLSKEGVKVVVVEKDSLGSHASGFAPGSLNPTRLSPEAMSLLLPLSWESFQMHGVLSQELKEEAGIDYHFCPSPRIILAFTQSEATELRSMVDSQQRQGFKVYWLDRGDVLSLESRVSPEVIGAVCSEDGAELDSYQYVLALAQAAEKYGAEIRHGDVIGLKRNGTKVTAVQLASGDIDCERVILAMGPWAGLASSWLGFTIPVTPQRGQVLRMQVAGSPFPYTLYWANHYITQTRHDGLIYTGTTHEDVGFDDQPTETGKDSIINGLLTMMPSLVEAELVLQTACLRPLPADGLPLLGEVPGWGGVYLATGHWTKGILLSPITARIITDLMVRGRASISIEPFAPTRFTGKES